VVVVRLTISEAELHQQTIGVHNDMDLRGESSFSELESRNHANHRLETRTSGIALEADLTDLGGDFSD
jgi:hypothetical protein